MTLKPVVAAAIISAALVLISAGPTQAASCSSVSANGRTGYHVIATGRSCSSARARLRLWLNDGRFPNNSRPWYCLKGHRVNPDGWLCSAVRSYIVFDTRRS